MIPALFSYPADARTKFVLNVPLRPQRPSLFVNAGHGDRRHNLSAHGLLNVQN